MGQASHKLRLDIGELGNGNLLVITGAGISAASGIPTFRGPEKDAVWRESDIRMATYEYFRRDPVGQLSWYLDRFFKARQAKPNSAHKALVDLEDWVERFGGTFQLVTQNIDTLHEMAGTRHLIKVHGSLERVRCSSVDCPNAAPHGSLPLPLEEIEAFRQNPSDSTLPRCPACSSILRAHVLFFDEHYFEHADYQFREVERSGSEAGLIVFVGTSFSVGVTELLVRLGHQRRVPMYSIDPAKGKYGQPGVTQISKTAETVLPRLVDALLHEV